jgi:hypothetical protein
VTAATARILERPYDARRYRQEVESLLEQIRGGVAELRRLKVAGVRGAALAERKQELSTARNRLAAVVGTRQP